MKKEDYKIKIYNDGYDLCNADGVVLYTQRAPFDKVYPGETYRDRAENHINALVAAEAEHKTLEQKIEETIENQTNIQLAIAELYESMTTGGTQ